MFQSRRSLSTLMILVVPVAIDLVAFRAIVELIANPSGSYMRGAYCLLGLLPILTASFFGTCSLANSLSTCGRARPFAVGFVAATFVSGLAYAVVCSLGFRPAAIMAYLQPLAPALSESNARTWVPLLLLGYAVVVSVPQFLAALAGGWLFRHFGVTLCRDLESQTAAIKS
jgi:hypothetical protein